MKVHWTVTCSTAILLVSGLSGCPVELSDILDEDPDCCCTNTTTGNHEMVPGSKCHQQMVCGDDGRALCRSYQSGGMTKLILAKPLWLAANSGIRFNLESFDKVGDQEALSPTEVTMDECVAKCKGTNADAFYCFSGTLTLPTQHGDGVRFLEKRFKSGGSVFALTKHATLKAFGYKTDPCDRSDTVVVDSQFRNVGHACVADLTCTSWDETTSTCKVHGQNEMKLNIPMVVEGYLANIDGEERVTFPDPSRSPSLLIDTGTRNPEWGGAVVAVQTSSDGLTVAFSRSCARISY